MLPVCDQRCFSLLLVKMFYQPIMGSIFANFRWALNFNFLVGQMYILSSAVFSGSNSISKTNLFPRKWNICDDTISIEKLLTNVWSVSINPDKLSERRACLVGCTAVDIQVLVSFFDLAASQVWYPDPQLTARPPGGRLDSSIEQVETKIQKRREPGQWPG